MMSVDLFVKGLPEYLTYCENLVYGQFIYNLFTMGLGLVHSTVE